MQPAFNCSGAHLRGQTTTGPVDEPSNGVQPYQFVLEADHFADCVRNNKQPRTPGEEGLKNMLLMEEQVIRSHSLDQHSRFLLSNSDPAVEICALQRLFFAKISRRRKTKRTHLHNLIFSPQNTYK